MRRRPLSALGEPVHVAQIYMGQTKPGGAPVSEETRKAVVGVVERINGGATVVQGHGYYIDAKAEEFDEPSIVLTVVTSGQTKCSKVKERIRRAAAEAAKIGEQSSVLAMVHCASGETDAELVDQSGRRERALPDIRASERTSAGTPEQ